MILKLLDLILVFTTEMLLMQLSINWLLCLFLKREKINKTNTQFFGFTSIRLEFPFVAVFVAELRGVSNMLTSKEVRISESELLAEDFLLLFGVTNESFSLL